MATPLLRRAWICAASWLVPSRSRLVWRARQLSDLANWWALVERGDLSARTGAELSRRTLAQAWSARFEEIDIGHMLRSAWVVPAAFAVALAAIALLSHGFEVTRVVIDVARDMRRRSVPSYDTRGDRIFVYVAPMLLALTTGLALLVTGCLSLRGRGWRYWAFLALKVVAVCAVVPLFWAELGTATRAHIDHHGWRVTAGLVMAIGFVIAMGRAMIWCVADQRRRCQTCLRRLILPVTVGSWASQFEPSATEMLCEDGHGALKLADAENTGEDQWTRLDDSWRAMFR